MLNLPARTVQAGFSISAIGTTNMLDPEPRPNVPFGTGGQVRDDVLLKIMNAPTFLGSL